MERSLDYFLPVDEMSLDRRMLYRLNVESPQYKSQWLKMYTFSAVEARDATCILWVPLAVLPLVW